MKLFKFIFLSFILIQFAYSEDEKKYTEAEFKEKLKAEVERKVGLIKKKTLTQFANELLEKEDAIREKERKLSEREEQLKKGEASLLKKITELETSKNKIIGCIDEHNKNEELRVTKVVEMISGMKPAKAAGVLSTLDSNISVKLLEKIDSTKASKIFNLMDKEVSARLQKQYLNMQQ